MTRPTGFYWVRRIHYPKEWQPAKWDAFFECWYLIGNRDSEGDYILEEIGPRIEEPS